MNKKKIFTLALVAIIAVAAITSASLAYFTDTKTAKNTITMGSVKITLDEGEVDSKGQFTDGGKRIEGGIAYGPDAVFPGAEIDKDPTVNNVGRNGAYIRATVNISDWANICGAYFPNAPVAFTDGYEETLMLLVGELGEGWSVTDAVAGDTFTVGQFDVKFILKYDGVLPSGESTTPIFSKVYVPTEFTNETASCLDEINIVAEAMQENSFNTWEEAFSAFDGEELPN